MTREGQAKSLRKYGSTTQLVNDYSTSYSGNEFVKHIVQFKKNSKINRVQSRNTIRKYYSVVNKIDDRYFCL